MVYILLVQYLNSEATLHYSFVEAKRVEPYLCLKYWNMCKVNIQHVMFFMNISVEPIHVVSTQIKIDFYQYLFRVIATLGSILDSQLN